MPFPEISHCSRLALSLSRVPLSSPEQVVRNLSNSPVSLVQLFIEILDRILGACSKQCCALLCLEIDAAAKATVECRFQVLHLLSVFAQLLFDSRDICIDLFD